VPHRLVGLFERPNIERFIDLADDRTLFLPHGRGGPVYLVPDDETRIRLIRRFKVVDRIAGFAFGTGAIMVAVLRAWEVMPLLMLTALLLPKWMERAAVESLPEAHDPDALEAARRGRPEPSSIGAHLGALAVGAGLGVYGYFRFHDGGPYDHLAILAVLGAVWLLVTTLQSWGDERPDDYQAAVHAPPDNRPNEPKYF
jgi:hypothetical protein